MKTRILSDLHLGHSATRLRKPEMLRPLLDGIDRLVLAGDVWQQRYIGARSEIAKEQFEKLMELTKQEGIQTIVLHGNHDPESGQGVARLAGGRVLVTHGDAVFDDATPWSREMGKYRDQVDQIVAKFDAKKFSAEACTERAKEIALTLQPVPLPKLPPPLNLLSTALWPPRRTFEMIRVWNGMGREGLRFLRQSGGEAEILICGHFHRAGIWSDDYGVMINTGAFMNGSRPWCVDLNGHELIARVVTLRDEQFHPDQVKGWWRFADQ